MDLQRAASQGDEKAHSKIHKALLAPARGPQGSPGAMFHCVFATIAPDLGRPRAKIPCTVCSDLALLLELTLTMSNVHDVVNLIIVLTELWRSIIEQWH